MQLWCQFRQNSQFYQEVRVFKAEATSLEARRKQLDIKLEGNVIVEGQI